VCLPADVLDALNSEPLLPTVFPSTRVVPEPGLIEQAATYLAQAQHPLIIMGDGIATAGAQDELTRVAELLGAEVWGADSSEVNLSYTHPLFKGMLGHMFGSTSSKVTLQADAILIVGTYVFPEVYPNLEDVFAPGARTIHVDLNGYEIAKNFPVDLGLLSDPKLTLAALGETLNRQLSAGQRQAAQARTEAFGAANQSALTQQRERDAAVRDEVPLHAARFMAELAQQVPPDVMIFDEALTVSPDLTRYIPPTLPGHFFQTRGGSLGVGIPGALGLKLAHPEKTVIGFTGDGGSMYTIQALWTAARYNIGAKFVICNNQSYMLLKLNILQYWQEQVGVEVHAFPHGFDLDNPMIDFAALSQSLGVPATRVEHPDQVAVAIRQMLEHNGPFLLDLVISNQVPGA